MARKSAESLERHRAYMRSYHAARRIATIAAGLNSKGEPSSRPPGQSPHTPSPEQSRALGLEALTWMATKKWREPGYLLGLHAYAANLPLDWWNGRAHYSIAALVDAIDLERQKHSSVVA